MVLPGHIAGGYIVTRGLIALTNPGLTVSPDEVTFLTILGTIAGEFPDMDLIRFYFEQKTDNPKIKDHRDYITHTPLFWLLICTAITGIGLASDSMLVIYSGIFILGGAISHLLFDSIEYGAMWLWPINKRRYSLIKKIPINTITAKPGSLSAHWQFVKSMYLKTWTVWAELIVTAIALILFFK